MQPNVNDTMPSCSSSTVIKAHWSMVSTPRAHTPAAGFHNKPATSKYVLLQLTSKETYLLT